MFLDLGDSKIQTLAWKLPLFQQLKLQFHAPVSFKSLLFSSISSLFLISHAFESLFLTLLWLLRWEIPTKHIENSLKSHLMVYLMLKNPRISQRINRRWRPSISSVASMATRIKTHFFKLTHCFETVEIWQKIIGDLAHVTYGPFFYWNPTLYTRAGKFSFPDELGQAKVDRLGPAASSTVPCS